MSSKPPFVATEVVALVTGANRGIGRGFVDVLLARDAPRIYASARRLESLEELVESASGRVIPVELDVTKPQQAAAAAERCTDVNMLVNNAGIVAPVGQRRFIGAAGLDEARLEMEVNFWGMLHVCRAFAPVLGSNGGGVIINILSGGGVAVFPQVGTYCASKWAGAALSRGVRAELHGQGTHVSAVMTGAVATDMSRPTPGKKISPEEHAEAVLAAVAEGQEEIYPDFRSQGFRDAIAKDEKAFERSIIAQFVD